MSGLALATRGMLYPMVGHGGFAEGELTCAVVTETVAAAVEKLQVEAAVQLPAVACAVAVEAVACAIEIETVTEEV